MTVRRVPAALLAGALLACGSDDGGAGDGTAADAGESSPDAAAADGAAPGAVGPIWSRAYPLSPTRVAVAASPDGGVLLFSILRADHPVDFGGGELAAEGVTDAVLLSLGPDGAHRFSQRLGGPDGLIYLGGVSATATGDVLVSGSFNGDLAVGDQQVSHAGLDQNVFAAKLSAGGEALWLRQFGDAEGQHGENATATADGGVILVGRFLGTITFGDQVLTAEAEDAFVARLDAAGEPVWARQFGGAFDDRAHAVAIDAAGAVLVAGTFEGTVDFGGGDLTASGTSDYFLVKLDRDGAVLWRKRLGTDGPDGIPVSIASRGTSVALAITADEPFDAGGGVIDPLGGNDVLVAEYDADGVHLWSRAIGSIAAQVPYGLAAGAGDLLVAGATHGTVDFGDGPVGPHAGGVDLFAGRLGAGGAVAWGVVHGSSTDESAGAAALAADGAAYLAGRFDGELAFGDDVHTASGAEPADVFLVKLAR